MHNNFSLIHLALLAVLSGAFTSSARAQDSIAANYLRRVVSDPQNALTVLTTLRQIGGDELTALYIAASRSSDRNHRMLGTMTLGQFNDPRGHEALIDRIDSDPTSAIRQQALGQLVQAGKVDIQTLKRFLDTGDEGLQSIAARAIVMAGEGQVARPYLVKLAASNDPATACLARMNLLTIGQMDQLELLKEIIESPDVTAEVIEIICLQAMEQKIRPVEGLLERIASSNYPMHVRLRALKALAELSPDGSAIVERTLRQNDNIVQRMLLLRMLVLSEHAHKSIENLAGLDDIIGEAARFELLRDSSPTDAQSIAMRLIDSKHPIVIGHLLDRISHTIEQESPTAEAFVGVLATIVENTPPAVGQLTQSQEHSAWAARMLADLNTPESMAALSRLLDSSGYTASRRAAVAGLLQTTNPQATAMAHPLLDSPYEELAITAAIAMARHGHDEARPYLVNILKNTARHRQTISILAAWYLLKLDGQDEKTAAELAEMVK